MDININTLIQENYSNSTNKYAFNIEVELEEEENKTHISVIPGRVLCLTSSTLVSLTLSNFSKVNVVRLLDLVDEKVQVVLSLKEDPNVLQLVRINQIKKKNLKLLPHQPGNLWNRSLQHLGQVLAVLDDSYYDNLLVDFTFLVRIFSFQVILLEFSLRTILGRFCRRHDLNVMVQEAQDMNGHVRELYLANFSDVLAKRFFWDSGVSPFNFILPIDKSKQEAASNALAAMLRSRS